MRLRFRRNSPRAVTPVSTVEQEKTVISVDQTSSALPWRIFSGLVYLISAVFLMLVLIGNINDKAVIRSTYFLKINLANVVPASVPNAVFINSIAQSIGLHDFYQVGLWSFCEGYVGQGITSCSSPTTLYYFNPVSIILSELLAGATIALPATITDALDIARTASHWMFGCFISGTCVTIICIFISPIGFSSRPRWQHRARRTFLRELPILLFTFMAFLLVAVGSVVATVMYSIFKNVFTNAADLNISADLGPPMLAFMWTAVALNLIGFLMQLFTSFRVCCCSGRRKASRKGQSGTSAVAQPSPPVATTS